MSLVDVLEEVGLTNAEARVYLVLLETGLSTVGPLIKKVGFHRGTTYAVLQRLLEKGFVSTLREQGKIVFAPVEPKHILLLLKEKEKRFVEALPELERIRAEAGSEAVATVFVGTRAIRRLLESILEELKKEREYLDFGVSGLFRAVMREYWDVWQARKRQWNIRSKCIFDENVKKKNSKLLEDYVGSARFVPSEAFCPTDTMIFSDKIVLFVWTSKPPVAIVVKNKPTAEGYKRLFNYFWKRARK